MLPMSDLPVYREEEWQHGLRCAACGEQFVEGQPIARRLDAFQDDSPMLVLMCVACDVAAVPVAD